MTIKPINWSGVKGQEIIPIASKLEEIRIQTNKNTEAIEELKKEIGLEKELRPFLKRVTVDRLITDQPKECPTCESPTVDGECYDAICRDSYNMKQLRKESERDRRDQPSETKECEHDTTECVECGEYLSSRLIPKDKIKGLRFGELIIQRIKQKVRNEGVSKFGLESDVIDTLVDISNDELEKLLQEYLEETNDQNKQGVEEAELRGVGKILDILWDNSFYSMGKLGSDRIREEMEYYFGENWTTDMYDFIGSKGNPRPELVKTLKELKDSK